MLEQGLAQLVIDHGATDVLRALSVVLYTIAVRLMEHGRHDDGVAWATGARVVQRAMDFTRRREFLNPSWQDCLDRLPPETKAP